MAFSTTPSDGNDRLRATADNQTINALAGNDWLRSVFDASTLYGGNGHDRITVSLGAPAPSDAENILSATLYGGNGNDWFVTDLTVPEDWFGYSFTSLQSGGSGNDNISISAEGGPTRGRLDFEVLGGAGDDDIWIEEATDDSTNSNTVDAGSGSDTVYIASQFSNAGGESGSTINEVEAGDGDDDVFVYGEAGWYDVGAQNVVSGGEGNDRLEAHIGGGGGANTLNGGDGDDTVIAISEVGIDTGGFAVNSASGGDGDDTIELYGFAGGIWTSARHRANGDAGDDIITSTTDTRSSESDGNNTATADTRLDGGSGDDTLTATTIFAAEDAAEGGARLYGRTGNDFLRVYGGVENLLDGGNGDDTITGGTGADRIVGGSGADALRGGGGNDSFVLLWAAGGTPDIRDTIFDFGIGTAARGDDVIDVSAIDANVNRGGNQAFTFGGTGVGRLWVEDDPDSASSLVMANNGGPQMLVIAVQDWASRDASDWVRGDFVL